MAGRRGGGGGQAMRDHAPVAPSIPQRINTVSAAAQRPSSLTACKHTATVEGKAKASETKPSPLHTSEETPGRAAETGHVHTHAHTPPHEMRVSEGF